MSDNVRFLTTGDVARYCGASRMGVLRWIRQGKLKAHTTPGGHYRIRVPDFRDFLKRFDIPIDDALFEDNSQRVLVVTSDVATLGTIVEAVSAMPEGYEIDVALDCSSAVTKSIDLSPNLVIIDGALPEVDPPRLIHDLQAALGDGNLPALVVTPPAAHSADATAPASSSTTRQGHVHWLPLDSDALQSTIRGILAR